MRGKVPASHWPRHSSDEGQRTGGLLPSGRLLGKTPGLTSGDPPFFGGAFCTWRPKLWPSKRLTFPSRFFEEQTWTDNGFPWKIHEFSVSTMMPWQVVSPTDLKRIKDAWDVDEEGDFDEFEEDLWGKPLSGPAGKKFCEKRLKPPDVHQIARWCQISDFCWLRWCQDLIWRMASFSLRCPCSTKSQTMAGKSPKSPELPSGERTKSYWTWP